VIRFKIFTVLLLLTAGALLYADSPVTFQSDLPGEELIGALMEQMTPEELLGQVLMLGYTGDTASPATLNWIKERKIGGIKVFGWNANDLSVLADTIGTMQESALSTPLSIPLIVATDQEGGWVRHVKGDTSITPGNLAIGASGLPWDSYQTGYYIGMELRRLGINMNFAPTVDVYLNPLADVIGPRAFSQDPVQTGILGTAFFKGMDQAGVISTAKHYPGHGNADKDSHGTLPVIPSDRAFLESHDLIPYKMMIDEGLPAIMAGHLAFPNITGDNRPASLCPVFLKEILRDEMGYEGLIITDDLVMQGAQYGNRSLPEVCEEAIRAGSDFLLVSRSAREHERIWEYLTELIKEDPEFLKQLTGAAERVLRTKVRYLKRPDPVPLFPDPENLEADIPAAGSREFFFGQAVRSTTTIRQSKFPIPGDSDVLIAGLFHEFRNQGALLFPEADTLRIPYSFDSAEKWDIIDRIEEEADRKDYIIYCLSRYKDLRILKELEDIADKLIIVSALTPIYLNELPWVEDAVAVYGTGTESFQAGLGAVRGDFIPSGTLPVQLVE